MKIVAVALVLALLLANISALLPSRLIPHDHLIVGNVTAAQVHAHLDAEAHELVDRGGAPPGAEAAVSGPSISPAGGRIVSVPPALGLILALHFELALQPAALFLFIPFLLYYLNALRVSAQALPLASLDPPPR